jgi:hypothetical protein
MIRNPTLKSTSPSFISFSVNWFKREKVLILKADQNKASNNRLFNCPQKKCHQGMAVRFPSEPHKRPFLSALTITWFDFQDRCGFSYSEFGRGLGMLVINYSFLLFLFNVKKARRT